MKPEVITITRRDIQHGVQHDCWHCPAALAVQRHFLPGCKFDRVSIDNGIIHVSGVGIFIMPDKVNCWIAIFDEAPAQVKPLTFILWNLPQGRADYRAPNPWWP